MEQRFERVAIVLVALAVLGGCGVAQNTLAQDLAWQRWKVCEGRFPTVRIKEILPDGQIWFTYANGGADRSGVQECLKQAAADQARPVAVVAPPSAAPVTVRTSPSGVLVPVWKVGNEWAYRYETPSGAGTFVWSMDRVEMLEGQPHYVIKTGTREIFYRVADLAFTQETVDRKIVRQNTPSDWRFVAFPLVPGKSWDMTYHEVRPDARQTEDIRRTCAAETEETITVPAGSFQAVRVSCKNARNGAWVLTVWYSPQVAHIVREESSVTGGKRVRELISYRLR